MKTKRIAVKQLGKGKISELFDVLARNIEPKSELIWETPLDLTIAVVLSAQATDISVNKATESLFKVCRCPDDYIDLGETRLRNYVKSIGPLGTESRAQQAR